MSGNMLKVAACNVKPYELILREEDKVDDRMEEKEKEKIFKENIEEQVADNYEEIDKIDFDIEEGKKRIEENLEE